MVQSNDVNAIGANQWLLDSGSFNHMTPNETLFTELDNHYRSRVKIGNGVFLESTRKGLAVIQTTTGSKYVLEALLVLEITQNLLSVGQMLEHDYVLLFKDKCCTIYAPSGDYLMIIPMKQKCLPVNRNETCLQIGEVKTSLTTMWHKRLSDYNYGNLKLISNFGAANNFPRRFWATATSTTIYLFNFILARARTISLSEVWYETIC
ncbi:Uncharacterized protein TCM_017481 [Theobroma cacao]|uniref:Retrovirus-related Pol polyprotein from transposon TNT 1-94-like beta-barrel domain-containing protein n=1 Tax=Theobroma cacao TaxID=3641 RepID=A0A061EDJ1_THECC|nr:Uncharacterized protein TCM_017481 [Theobroma cacao]